MEPYSLNINNFGFELMRATELTALTVGRWGGKGDRTGADEIATQTMMNALDRLPMIGYMMDTEARKVGHSQLDNRNNAGAGSGLEMDVIADAVDGIGLLSEGRPGAISVVCAAPQGSMHSLNPALYMEKIVVDRQVATALVPECLEAPAAWTLSLVARAKGKDLRDLVVFVLDRPRHYSLIEDIRRAGARAQIFHDGDVAGGLLAMIPESGLDVLMGIGGTLEGLIMAGAVKGLGGAMLGRITPQSEAERRAVLAANLDMHTILTADDLITGDEVFFAATGVTDGPLLSGVTYQGNLGYTQSMVIRGSTGIRRMVQTEHRLSPETNEGY